MTHTFNPPAQQVAAFRRVHVCKTYKAAVIGNADEDGPRVERCECRNFLAEFMPVLRIGAHEFEMLALTPIPHERELP